MWKFQICSIEMDFSYPHSCEQYVYLFFFSAGDKLGELVTHNSKRVATDDRHIETSLGRPFFGNEYPENRVSQAIRAFPRQPVTDSTSFHNNI